MFYFQDETDGNTCKTSGCKYAWLYDRTSNTCENYGCLNNASGTSTDSYWTSDAQNVFEAFTVSPFGELFNPNGQEGSRGLRPVITIDKSLLN